MPTPLSPLAALEQVLQSPVSAASLVALPGRTLVMVSPNMSLLSHHGSTLPLPVSLARVPTFSPCSHCSLAEHIASSSAFLHTQMSPGALLELAPGGSSALWAPRAGVSAPAPLQPCGTQGTVPSPLAQHAEGPAV